MLSPVKKSRLVAGYSQGELAAMMGVSRVSVSKWETGKANPNVKRLKKLAEILNTSVEELINE